MNIFQSSININGSHSNTSSSKSDVMSQSESIMVKYTPLRHTIVYVSIQITSENPTIPIQMFN